MFAVQQPGHRRRYLPVDFLETRAVAGEPTLFRAFRKLIDRRHPQISRTFEDHLTVGVEDDRCQHIERRCASRMCGVDSRPDLLHLRCAMVRHLNSPRTSGINHGTELLRRFGGRLDKCRHPTRTGHQFQQELANEWRGSEKRMLALAAAIERPARCRGPMVTLPGPMPTVAASSRILLG